MTATPMDDGVPPATGAPFVTTHRVACAYLATGQLAFGLAGQETFISARTVAVRCPGLPYTLTSKAPNDLDVCWYAGPTLLRCDSTAGGDEAGTVPLGATEAHIILVTGLQAPYRLQIRP